MRAMNTARGVERQRILWSASRTLAPATAIAARTIATRSARRFTASSYDDFLDLN